MKETILAVVMNVLFSSVNSYGMEATISDQLQKAFTGTQNIRVITVTRNSDVYGYGSLDIGEINLIFAQLAACMSNPNVVRDFLSTRTNGLALQIDVMQKYEENIKKQTVVAPGIVTIVLFNEMFFGKDIALTKSEVDNIISCYQAFHRFLPNTFLHINFLYKDVCNPSYERQLQESRAVYMEIREKDYQFPFMNFIDCEDSGEYYDDKRAKNDALCKEYMGKILATEMAPSLLFNQTKIFFNGQEIGFYNKSSYYLESVAEFLDETNGTLKTGFPFYVIGNFRCHYSEFLALSEHWEYATGCKAWVDKITNLVCYDVDAIENDVSYKRGVGDTILFSSNSYYYLLANIANNWSIYTTGTKGKKSIICADPEGTELKHTVLKEDNRIIMEGNAITGVLKMNSETIFPIEPINAISPLDFSFGPNKYSIRIYDLNLTQ